jgi:methylmalonic aciduria homocystinuria type C protein
MVVHPELGPWLALRAALVLDLTPPEEEPGAARDPCSGCAKPCLPALQSALAAGGAGAVRQHWRAWLAVRDACPEGREARYGEAQIRYHYALDRSALEGPV